MENENKFWTIKNICLIALFAVILFVQEEVLSFLPNIQLTVFLIILYSKLLGFGKTSIIVIIYFLLDCIFMGSWNPLYISFQLVGWMIIPIMMCTLFKRVDNNIILALLAAMFALLYSWIMIFPNSVVFGTELLPTFIADLPFEALLAGSSFLSTLLLYNPLFKVCEKLLHKKA